MDYVLKQMGINTNEIEKTTKSLSPDVVKDLEGIRLRYHSFKLRLKWHLTHDSEAVYCLVQYTD